MDRLRVDEDEDNRPLTESEIQQNRIDEERAKGCLCIGWTAYMFRTYNNIFLVALAL